MTNNQADAKKASAIIRMVDQWVPHSSLKEMRIAKLEKCVQLCGRKRRERRGDEKRERRKKKKERKRKKRFFF